MKWTPGIDPGNGPAAGRAWANQAWRALLQVLIGPDPPPAWRWQSPQERRTAWTALALATLLCCVANLARISTPAQLLLAVPVVAPLPLAARYPMLAWRIGWLALLLVPLAPAGWWGGWPWGPGQLAALLGAFCLAGIRQHRLALGWMWALSLIPWWLWLTADLPNLHGPVGAAVVFTAVAIVADSTGSRLRAQLALTTETKRVEDEQQRRAVLEERTRIARELHDVVAHHMSLIAVRAETAPYRLAGLPESARAEFSSLSEIAREALTEMRRLLGVLRDDAPADLAPQPELADLPTLVEGARQAGVSIELSAPASLAPVPSGVGVCAYRIVQESLSNASQHAPGADVTVKVDQDSGAVLLRIANGPLGPRPGPAPGPRPGPAPGPARKHSNDRGPGHGLTGMRERVALLGGSLSAGPSDDGGFVVTAVLPLGDPA